MSVRVFAPAKINLTLKVGRPRADGLHPLQSVVAFADVGDWVEAREADGLSLSVRGPFAHVLVQSRNPLPLEGGGAGEGVSSTSDGAYVSPHPLPPPPLGEGESLALESGALTGNLVLRAARALADAAGIQPKALLSLEKNLPVAAGIGGGSSDAAATLKALNELWGLNLEMARLAEIGFGIGADVPVCLRAQASYVTSVGETNESMTLPSLHAVLVNALRPVSTAEVFHKFDQMVMGSTLNEPAMPRWLKTADAIASVKAIGNDLEASALAIAPEIEIVKAALRADARIMCASLSGSGGTMFALVDDSSVAEELASELQSAHPNWWITATRLA